MVNAKDDYKQAWRHIRRIARLLNTSDASPEARLAQTVKDAYELYEAGDKTNALHALFDTRVKSMKYNGKLSHLRASWLYCQLANPSPATMDKIIVVGAAAAETRRYREAISSLVVREANHA